MGVTKKTLLAAVAAVAVVAGAAAVLIALPPGLGVDRAQGDADAALVAKGRYVAALGDCVACHTDRGGAEMAGGRAFATPFGTVWSTNITPDAKTGLGGWSFAQFDRAMRKGVSADGSRLYPAMPYPSYAKVSDEDMRALWAYLSRGLAPVAKADRPADMRFPFNLRFGLAYWDFVFADKSPFYADAGKDASWNRGAYLVEGLGHCGACHTPRGLGFQELAMADAGETSNAFLAGAQVERWNAVDLRGLWSVDDATQFLATGQNRFAAAAGGMTEVIEHSSQHMSPGDRAAIAVYLRSLPSDRRPPANVVASGEPPAATFTTRGGLGYTQFCSDCHRPDGAGVKGLFPPLAGNPTVAANDASTLLHITLTGWTGPSVEAAPRAYTMPSLARLSDKEIAEILSFVRQNFGAGAAPIPESQVASARADLAPKVEKRPFETPRVADLLAQPNADELVRGLRLNSETAKLLPKNVGDDLNCSSCHLQGGTIASASPYVGVSAFFPSYAARAGRVITMAERINGCFLRSENGKPLPVDSADMKAMIAYFDWMKGSVKAGDKVPGRGVGNIDPALKPDPAHGKLIYAAQCAACHGEDGEGLKDASGRIIYPPLWGDRSFNIGAGLARTYTAAAFVHSNMPVASHDKFDLGQGGLSEQDALDVGDYFSHMPRGDFAAKVDDWPKDPKPKDARY